METTDDEKSLPETKLVVKTQRYLVKMARSPEGSWRECEVLKIIRDGEEIAEYMDQGEPEDNRFCRDWNWVAGALEQAYQFGLADGKKELAAEIREYCDRHET